MSLSSTKNPTAACNSQSGCRVIGGEGETVIETSKRAGRLAGVVIEHKKGLEVGHACLANLTETEGELNGQC